MQIKKQELGEAYGFLDPSGAKNQRIKRVSARSAIVIAQEGPFNQAFIVEAWAQKCTTDEMTEKVFHFVKKYRLRQFGIEANAMQTLYADSLIREARKSGIKAPFVPIYQPTNIDKEFRIRTTLQPWIGNGRLI